MKNRPIIWIEVNLGVIIDNINLIRSYFDDNTQIVVGVQGNGFGHGAAPVARAVAEKARLGLYTTFVDDAIELRNAGVEGDIFIAEHIEAQDADYVVKYSLTPAVSSLHVAQILSEAARSFDKQIRVYLNVEIGQEDIEIEENSVLQLFDAFVELPYITLEGINYCLSPLIPETEAGYRKILQASTAVSNQLKATRFVAFRRCPFNCVLMCQKDSINSILVGGAAYGIVDSRITTPSLAFKPSLSLKTRIVNIREGQHSTIFLRTESRREGRFATIPLGMHHGISYSLSGRGEVLVRGRRARIVGKIGVDMCQVDVTDIPDVIVGDEVVIIGQQNGDQITVEEIAEKSGTNSSDVLCRIGDKVATYYDN